MQNISKTTQGQDLLAMDPVDLEGYFMQLIDFDEDALFVDQLFAEIRVLPTIEAPDGFELEVMARIFDLKGNRYAVEVRVWDKARTSSLGTIVLFLGAGSVYAIFKDSLRSILSGSGGYSQLFGLTNTIQSTATSVSNPVHKTPKLLMSILAALIAVAAYLTKGKVRNENE